MLLSSQLFNDLVAYIVTSSLSRAGVFFLSLSSHFHLCLGLGLGCVAGLGHRGHEVKLSSQLKTTTAGGYPEVGKNNKEQIQKKHRKTKHKRFGIVNKAQAIQKKTKVQNKKENTGSISILLNKKRNMKPKLTKKFCIKKKFITY